MNMNSVCKEALVKGTWMFLVSKVGLAILTNTMRCMVGHAKQPITQKYYKEKGK
jgi:hypothetical protein